MTFWDVNQTMKTRLFLKLIIMDVSCQDRIIQPKTSANRFQLSFPLRRKSHKPKPEPHYIVNKLRISLGLV